MPSKKAATTAKKVSKTVKPSKTSKPVKVTKVTKVAKTSAKPAAPTAKNAEVEAAKSYKELITEALVALKDRKGSSRPALKKHIKDKYPKVGSSTNFDLHFNNAIKKGVETKDFDQPKGPSGTLKLQKKTSSSTTSTSGTTATPAVNGHSVTKKPVSSVKKTKPTTTTEKKVVKKASSPLAAATPTYKEMILEGILQLNQGKGSSRPALKKFVKDQYSSTIKASANFDHLFNNAIKKGVETGDFVQPKGPSGVVKAMKKGKNKTLAQKKTV